MKKWARTRIRTPFLEDGMVHVFVRREKALDLIKLWGFSNMSDDKSKRFFFAMRSERQRKEDVYTDAQILRVKQVDSQKRVGVYYPSFIVIRSDYREWRFTEADLMNLNPYDIDFLYHWFRRQTIRPLSVQVAHRAVVRFMKMRIRFTMCHDLQLGLECGQNRINLLRPDQNLPNLERLQPFTINRFPEKDHGIIYFNAAGEKKIMRLNELECYSSGTIKLVKDMLREKFTHLAHLPARTHEQNLEFSYIKEADVIIQRLLGLRLSIRRWENYFRYRTDTRWSH